MTQLENGAAAEPRWGAMHIHTRYSDGRIDVPDVVTAARNAGLDFLVITDHNTLAAREVEGYHDDVLLVVDVEITPTPFRDHLIAVGLDEYPDLHRLKRPERYLDETQRLGGAAWVPHPLGFRNPWFLIYNSPWKIWDARIDGIELGTFLVEWVEGLRPWNALRKLRDPGSATVGVEPRALALWDRLNRTRPVAGYVGLDAHRREAFGGRLRLPSYEFLFGTNNLLAWLPPRTGDGARDAAAVREALGAARFVNVLGHVDARGEVLFELSDGNLVVTAPDRDGTILRVLRHGAPVCEREAVDVALETPASGVYRAEVWRHGRLWALTNPITVSTPLRAGAASAEEAGVPS